MNIIKKQMLVLLFLLVGGLIMQAQTSRLLMTTNLSTGKTFSFTLNYGASVDVDWGDGVLVPYTSIADSITGILKGQTVTVSGSDITMIECANVGLTDINVSDLLELSTLSCHNNELTTLDISKNTKLTKLNCAFNKLTSLSLNSTTELSELIVNDNQISILGLTRTKAIKTLICNNNNLSTLSLINLTGLKTLWCQNNQLTTLSATKNTTLETLICYNNQIATLNITGLTLLTDLWCDANKISDLNLSTNSALNYVSANNSSISKLTLSSPFNVKSLYLDDNNLGFSDLPSISSITNYRYSPQYQLPIPSMLDTNAPLDLSAQRYNANNVATNATFKWINDVSTLVAGVDYTESNAVFSFKKEFSGIYCEISSTLFPTLSKIITSTITVAAPSGFRNNEISQTLQIYNRDGKLFIKSFQPQLVQIFTTTGMLVKIDNQFEGTIEVSLPKGTYIVNNKKIIL